MNFFSSSKKGFTFVETLVGVSVFIIISVSVSKAYIKVMELLRLSQLKITVAALANEQFEIVRNLPYADVGISGGIPSGKIERVQTIERDNISFEVETTIRNIDDPFDGTIGGEPNDTSAADYKLVELEINCTSCKNSQPFKLTTQVAPRGLETSSTNGALFVQVFDAAGLPIQDVDVHIENNQIIPPIVIDDTTDNNGLLQIVDAPPGAEAYEITVSKIDYSQDSTYTTGAPENPNPVKPHATVALQQLTEISFAIDKTSTVNVESLTQTCSPIGNIGFSLQGSKIIGTDPDVPKYSESHITDNDGQKIISNFEWDTYDISFDDEVYDLAGTITFMPLILNPNSTQNLKLVVQLKDPNSLLVTVKEAGTQLPITDATARLQGSDFDTTLVVGQGALRQIDWSGGAGQEDFIDPSKYFDSDGNIEIEDPSGELRLKKIFDEYEPSGYLISSTFDTGSESNFHQLFWQPQNQPPETGIDSVKIQIATNNDKEIWDFVGPDGTSGSFYTLATPNINALHNSHQYFRYKVFLDTASTTYTPNVAEVAFTFTSNCVPPGQAFFTGLDAGDYNITVSKDGYETFNGTTTISAAWTRQEVLLAP